MSTRGMSDSSDVQSSYIGRDCEESSLPSDDKEQVRRDSIEPTLQQARDDAAAACVNSEVVEMAYWGSIILIQHLDKAISVSARRTKTQTPRMPVDRFLHH